MNAKKGSIFVNIFKTSESFSYVSTLMIIGLVFCGPISVLAQNAVYDAKILLPKMGGKNTFSLNQAIVTAIQNNPNQQANALQVEAANLDATAARKSIQLPSLSFNTGLNRNRLVTDAEKSSFSNSQDMGISASHTIYDGGANQHMIKSAELHAKALEAQLSSTDSYTPYTKGALAQSVKSNFIDINLTKASLGSLFERSALLQIILNHVDGENERVRITNSLVKTRNSYATYLGNYKLLKEDFYHVVYRDVPENLESIEEANERMKEDLYPYMNNLDLAIQTAHQKNQNYLSKLFALQAQKESAAAARARLLRPTISVNAGHYWDRYKSTGSPADRSRSTYAGISLNYSIDGGISDTLKASAKRIQAAQENVDYEDNEFVYQIKTTILRLNSSDREVALFYQGVRNDVDQINLFVAQKLTPGSKLSKDDVDYIESVLKDFDSNWGSYYSSLVNSLYYRYQLEVSIGILFDVLGYESHPQP